MRYLLNYLFKKKFGFQVILYYSVILMSYYNLSLTLLIKRYHITLIILYFSEHFISY